VGAAQVMDVDIVPDAGAIRGRVVCTVDFKRLLPAQAGLEYQRDDVGFGPVVFARTAICADDVEVAERNVVQAGRFVLLVEQDLEKFIGAAVGIGGTERRGFGNRYAARRAVDRRG
jgi:hypothetical protein